MKSPLFPCLISLLGCSILHLQAEDAVINARSGFENFRYRAAVEKKARVAFLGGSITQNAKGHTAMLPTWLGERFPDTAFSVSNAGLSSTCSVTGAFRVADELLAEGAVDLLVVEFAVNDDQDAAHDRATAIRGMEGIIRQVRARHPACDILMVHFINPDLLAKAESGERSVSIDAHEAVAAHWGITSVNLPVALAKSTAAGTMDWERYGGVHPNQAGYRWATDFLIEALRGGWSETAPAPVMAHPAPETPLDPGSYGQVRSLDLAEAAMLGGWTLGKVGKELMPEGAIRGDYLERPLLRATEPGSTLYVDFSGKALAAFVLAGPDAGVLEVSIDGGAWREVGLFHHHSKGLNYPRSVILADDLAAAYHQAAIRLSEKRPEGGTGHAASILKFGVNE